MPTARGSPAPGTAEPTDRYPHGALGDKIEAGALVVQDVYGHRVTVTLPADQVFEDLTPRIADLDGDGRNEVLAIRSSLRAGAALVAYDLAGSSLIEIDSTPPIGQPNRWVNVAGIADFTGDRSLDIAAVRTPHVGGTLEIVTLDRRRFRVVDSLKGFSNHVFGSTETGHVGGRPHQRRQHRRSGRARRRPARAAHGDGGRRVPARDRPRGARRGVVTAIGTLDAMEKPTFVLGLEDGRLIAISDVEPPKKRR